MPVDPLFHKEIEALLAVESGFVAALEEMAPCVHHRRFAQALVTLGEDATRHIQSLLEIQGYSESPDHLPENPLLAAWREEVRRNFLKGVQGDGALGDRIGLTLVAQAVHLKAALYTMARILAFQLERPHAVRTLRLALEDERKGCQRLENLAEMGLDSGSATLDSFMR